MKLNKISGTFLLLVVFTGFSQLYGENTSQVKITYQTLVNDEITSPSGNVIVLANTLQSKIFSENPGVKLIPQTPDEASYIDFNKKIAYQVADLFDGRRIYTETPFSEYPVLEETGETEEILGYTCKKVKGSLRSNSIEIWYTTELNVKGTPLMSHGIVDGLVMKVVRNGNYGLVATNIEKIKKRDAFGDTVMSKTSKRHRLAVVDNM